MHPFGQNRKLAVVSGILGVSVLMFFGWTNLITSVPGWDLPKTLALKHENERLATRAELLSGKLTVMQEELMKLGLRDDNVYRSIFGLSPVPHRTRMNAVPSDEGSGDGESAVGEAWCSMIRSRCDTLLNMAYVQSVSYDAVAGMVKNAGDMANHIPSICPLLLDKDVHFSSPFGVRFHPVLGYSRFHSGIDLATKRGRPVYATGDGVVEIEKVEMDGYGRQIFIDHGFGYKTRYAHLDQILLPEGVKVKKGEQIGTTGNTGLTSGPHLHYEVYYKGQCVNPRNYFDMDMPVQQYRDLINYAEEHSEKVMKIPGMH